MYKPWLPIDRILSTHPVIDWRVDNRSLILTWKEWKNNKSQFEMEIRFDDGIAGVLCLDESTYQTTRGLGIPDEHELDCEGFQPLPWPAWRSELNYRKSLYGELGEITYKEMYSYYFVGSETVLLLDIADAEPLINVTKD